MPTDILLIQYRSNREIRTIPLESVGPLALNRSLRKAWMVLPECVGELETPFQPAPLVLALVVVLGILTMGLMEALVLGTVTILWLALATPLVAAVAWAKARPRRVSVMYAVEGDALPIAVNGNPFDEQRLRDAYDQIWTLRRRGKARVSLLPAKDTDPVYLNPLAWSLLLMCITIALLGLFAVLYAAGFIGGR